MLLCHYHRAWSMSFVFEHTIAVPVQSFLKHPRHVQTTYKWCTTAEDLFQAPLHHAEYKTLLAPALLHLQCELHSTCTMMPCINVLVFSHGIIQQNLQGSRKRKKCGLKARYLGW